MKLGLGGQDPGRSGEVGDGLLADALAFSSGFSQQDGGGAVAVGDGFDVVGEGAIHTWKHICTLKRDFGGRIRRKINEIGNSNGFGGA